MNTRLIIYYKTGTKAGKSDWLEGYYISRRKSFFETWGKLLLLSLESVNSSVLNKGYTEYVITKVEKI